MTNEPTNGRTSLARIEANRLNAVKSTGPRTREGKAIVSHNALRHGLLAKEVVITRGEGAEDPRQFQRLRHQLICQLQPDGALEEMLVEKIAVCHWRLRRSLRCEMGEIRKRADSRTAHEVFRIADRFLADKPLLSIPEIHNRFERTSIGLGYLLNTLNDVRADVERLGYLSDESLRVLVRDFGADEEGLSTTCHAFSRMAKVSLGLIPLPPNLEAPPAPENCKTAILILLDGEKEKLNILVAPVGEIEVLQREATAASLALPPADALDKILRYETAIERQLYRAINQLERLQRQRRGEFLPPPVAITLSEDR